MKNSNLSKVAVFSLFCCIPMFLHGAASITGTALQNAIGVISGDYAVMLVDTSGAGFNTAGLSSLGAGVDLSDSASYSGFEVLFTTTATTFFGSTVVDINANNFDVLNQPIVSGDSFGILTFNGGSSTSLGGSIYEIWTDATWVIPGNNQTPSFGSSLAQKISASPTATGTVVPEPSSFALLAGVFGLAWVMVRRRA